LERYGGFDPCRIRGAAQPPQGATRLIIRRRAGARWRAIRRQVQGRPARTGPPPCA